MKKRIYKYQLKIEGNQSLMLPKGSEVLTVQVQGESLQLWCLVDPEKDLEERVFDVIGTGCPINDKLVLRYIATCQLMEGAFIVHVFENVNIKGYE